MVCTKCSKELNIEWKLCPHCGNPITEEEKNIFVYKQIMCFEEGYITDWQLHKEIGHHGLPVCIKLAEEGNLLFQLYLGTYHFPFKNIQVNGKTPAEERAHILRALFKNIQVNGKTPAEWYKMAADQGNAQGQQRLGNCYREGYWVKKDEAKAFQLYQQSAEQGDSEGQLCLGKCYLDGVGVNKDLDLAFHWLKKAALGGVSSGQLWLGDCYKNGWGVEKDDLAAFRWYRIVVDQGYNDVAWEARNKIKKLYSQGFEGNTEITNYWLSQAILGDEDAQFTLALYYLKNDNSKTNQQEAFYWMLRSAQSSQGGNAGSYIGHFYSAGIGVEKNDEEALKWYLKAYVYGSSSYNLPHSLNRIQQTAQELGIDWSDQVSFPWYLKFAQNGNPFWMAEVARRYEAGVGAERDEKAAFQMFLQAAKKGDNSLQYEVGLYYERGRGVDKSLTKAFFWYRKAAENGNSKGQFALGRFYEEGITIKKDMELALQWYQKAAKQGDELAKKKIKEIQSL